MAEMSPEQQLAQLQLLLSAVHRTRTALPRLVSTVTSSSSSTAGDRTTLYRTAHQECHAAITALQDQLDLNARTLEQADQVDSLLLPPPPPRPTSKATHASWDQVRDILQTTTTTTAKQGRRRSPHPPPPLPIPTTPANLEALIKSITQHYHHPRRVHIRTTGRVPPRQLELTLRGILRAHISLRWEEDGAGGCQADYVACYSLMEDPKPSHVDSQFALFRSLSNQAMNIIDQSRRSSRTAAVRSLEEVLVFLCDPPLPF